MTTTIATATPHTYASGRHFWIVTCDDCQVALNSGHHFQNVADAEACATDHNHQTH